MSKPRMMRVMKALAVGAFLLQAGGCSPLLFNEYLQTILLGVTAAGGVAILQNI